MRFFDFVKENWLFLVILIVAVILHWVNGNNYPSFFMDENDYTARAWSFLTYHTVEIYPLTYDYDNPFGGWILLSLFIGISPGEFWIEKARFEMIFVFMILLVLIYLFCKKYLNKTTGLIAISIYAFTNPIIALSRMVLINNIATVFFFASVVTFAIDKKKWIFSAVFFGLAGLVKYTYFIFFPGFVLLYIYLQNESLLNTLEVKKKLQINIHAMIQFFCAWLGLALLLFAIWPLYAIITNTFYVPLPTVSFSYQSDFGSILQRFHAILGL